MLVHTQQKCQVGLPAAMEARYIAAAQLAWHSMALIPAQPLTHVGSTLLCLIISVVCSTRLTLTRLTLTRLTLTRLTLTLLRCVIVVQFDVMACPMFRHILLLVWRIIPVVPDDLSRR